VAVDQIRSDHRGRIQVFGATHVFSFHGLEVLFGDAALEPLRSSTYPRASKAVYKFIMLMLEASARLDLDDSRRAGRLSARS